LVEDFFQNKLSPIAGEGLNSLKGETREGGRPFTPSEPLTWIETAGRLITPLPVKNTMEVLKDPNAAPLVATLILDGLGFGANTYGGSKDILQQIKKAEVRGDQAEVERLRKALTETLEIERKKKQEAIERNRPQRQQ
jgi:hypothetical protein